MTKNSPIEEGGVAAKKIEFDRHVDKCLSMVYHYPIIEEIGVIVKRIGHKRLIERTVSDGRHKGNHKQG